MLYRSYTSQDKEGDVQRLEANDAGIISWMSNDRS